MSVSPTLRLDLAGALLLAGWSWLAWLSRTPQQLSVWLFMLVMGVAWGLVLCAWRTASHIDPRRLLVRICVWAVLFRVAGFFGQPLLETDFYRYLWDGRQFALTGNPYATAPIEHFGAIELPAPFGRVLDRINYPDVPTIYGPVTELSFLFSYWIAPGQLWPLKLLLIVADLLTLRLLLDLAKPRHLLLYAWCPLLIKETAFTAHPDSLGVLFLVAAIHALRRERFARVALFAGIAAATKVFALLLAPFLLLRTPRKYWALFGVAAAAFYLPFWLQGSTADLAGLTAFVRDWEFNSSVHGVLSWLLGTHVGSLLCRILFVGAWFACFAHWRSASSDAVPRGDWIYGLFLLFAATVNPWYLLWLLPFVAVFPSVTGITALVVVSLSYVSGLNLGDADLIGQHPWWVRPLEYGVLLTAFVVELWRRSSARSRPYAMPDLPREVDSGGSFLNRTIVVIPALNEAGCVAGAVAYWKQLGARVVRVVDNGSTDATAEVARAAGAQVLSEPKRGYGAAAWRGVQEIPDDIQWILFSSADGSDRLTAAELSDWQRHVDDGFDLVLGDRVSDAQSRGQLKRVQAFGNRLGCALIRLGWGRRFKDMGSLRLVRRVALERLNLQDRGFGWNVEMQVRAIEQGLRVAELPVVFHPRMAGESKISGNFKGTLKAGWGILCMVAKLWWTKRAGRKVGREAAGSLRNSQAATFAGNKPCCIPSEVVNTKP